MDSPIGEVAFLARSETRVDVLRAVGEEPRDRRELAAVTDTPRSTLARTLGELEERGWIERNGQVYEPTTAGSLFIRQFLSVLDTVTVLRTVGDAVELLPFDEPGFDVRDLADAQFVTPTGMDPTAPFDYGIERLRETDQFRCVARTAPPRYVEAIHDGVVTGRFTAECVLDEAYLDKIRDDETLTEWWDEIAADSSPVGRCEESISLVLLVLDEAVHFWLCDGEGASQGLVESENPAVVSWANGTVDRYLERAQPIETVLSKNGQ